MQQIIHRSGRKKYSKKKKKVRKQQAYRENPFINPSKFRTWIQVGALPHKNVSRTWATATASLVFNGNGITALFDMNPSENLLRIVKRMMGDQSQQSRRTEATWSTLTQPHADCRHAVHTLHSMCSYFSIGQYFCIKNPFNFQL